MGYVKDHNIEQEDSVEFSTCPLCEQDIYIGEEYYLIDGESICDNCILEHVKQYKEVAS